ncbi:MAG: filamentous hemagglutinin N-terminal domain-containing protein, partial [Planctomycetota bacterium]
MMKGLRKLLKRYYVNQILAFMLVSFMLVNPVLAVVPPPSDALPTGESIPGIPGQYGWAIFTRGPGNYLLIRNNATKTVINWATFDIGEDATTEFQQPIGTNPWVLNRVTGPPSPSGIYGDLISNGGVILVNTSGIVFGPASSVTARDFIASGIYID